MCVFKDQNVAACTLVDCRAQAKSLALKEVYEVGLY